MLSINDIKNLSFEDVLRLIKSGGISEPTKITLDLTTAATDKEFCLVGNYFGIIKATSIDTLVKVKFNKIDSPQFDFTQGLYVLRPYDRVFLSWSAQSGQSIEIITSALARELYDIIDNRSEQAQSSLLQQIVNELAGVSTGSYNLITLNNQETHISQETDDTNTTQGDVTDIEYRTGQRFILSATKTIKSVSIKFGVNIGSPSGQVTARIETVSNEVPTGTLAHANATKAITPTPSAWNEFVFDSSFELAAGTYAIVLTNANQTTGVAWTVRISNTNIYTDGTWLTSNNGGSTWTADGANRDLCFRIKTTKPPTLVVAANTSRKSVHLFAPAANTDKILVGIDTNLSTTKYFKALAGNGEKVLEDYKGNIYAFPVVDGESIAYLEVA